jgi:hypothetical protein
MSPTTAHGWRPPALAEPLQHLGVLLNRLAGARRLIHRAINADIWTNQQLILGSVGIITDVPVNAVDGAYLHTRCIHAIGAQWSDQLKACRDLPCVPCDNTRMWEASSVDQSGPTHLGARHL